jgi:hypothetical protein
MNQPSRMLLSPYIIVATILLNFLLIIGFWSSNANALGSSIKVIENLNWFDTEELVIISLLFLMIIGRLLMCLFRALKKRKKKRRLFTAQTKRIVLQSQKFKCLICRTNVGIWDYDHKDGNRGNNKLSNCQALCPICHAKKSRGLIKCQTQRKGKNIGIGVSVGIILIMILFSYNI